MIITAENPSLEIAEKTYITGPIAVGATAVNVKSSDDFAQNDYCMLGEQGIEKTEIKKVNAAVSSKTQLTFVATDYSHSEGDPVYFMRYNQVKFYMATTLTGTYTLQTTVEIDVDNPDNITVWDDTDGVSTNYYKVSYYNDVTTLESSLSDPIPGGGTATTTVRYITDRVLGRVKDPTLTNRDEIVDWLNDCNADVSSRRRKWEFLKRRVASSRQADRAYYSLSADFGATNVKTIDYLEYNLDDSVSDVMYRLRYITPEEYDLKTYDVDLATDDNLQAWTWDESVDYIRVYPTPATTMSAVLYLHYYKEMDALDSDGDTLEIPDVRIYEYFCLQMYHLKNENMAMADRYGMKYEQAVNNLARRERKEIGQPYGFSLVKKNIRRYYRY